jgi:hypothetical protein
VNKKLFLSVWASLIGLSLLATTATAQAPTLQEQLAAQYKLTKVGSDGSIIGDPGTPLLIQKHGIIAVPSKSLTRCPAKFKDNDLHPSTGFCVGMVRNVARIFKQGAKVYPVKIDVNLDKSKISFEVVGPKGVMTGQVDFEFPKGYLQKASASEVEDTIGQVFTITTEDQAPNNTEADQQQPADQPQAQPAQPEAQQAEPQSISLGMSPDQVEAALGKPDKIVNLGAKQIYVYKDLKVTFMNGKVSDVQ